MGMIRAVWVGQARVWVGHGLPGLIARTASASDEPPSWVHTGWIDEEFCHTRAHNHSGIIHISPKRPRSQRTSTTVTTCKYCWLVLARQRAHQFAVRLAKFRAPVWKIVLFVEAEQLMNGVERVREMYFQRVLLILAFDRTHKHTTDDELSLSSQTIPANQRHQTRTSLIINYLE